MASTAEHTLDDLFSRTKRLDEIFNSAKLTLAQVNQLSSVRSQNLLVGLVVHKWFHKTFHRDYGILHALDTAVFKTKVSGLVLKLQQLLLTLDGVDSHGDADLRLVRRQTAHYINDVALPAADDLLQRAQRLVLLQEKANIAFGEDENSDVTEEDMEEDSDEAHGSDEKDESVNEKNDEGAVEMDPVHDRDDHESESDEEDDEDEASSTAGEQDEKMQVDDEQDESSKTPSRNLALTPEPKSHATHHVRESRENVIITVDLPNEVDADEVAVTLKEGGILAVSDPKDRMKDLLLQADGGTLILGRTRTMMDERVATRLHLIVPRRMRRVAPVPQRRFVQRDPFFQEFGSHRSPMIWSGGW